MSKPKAIGAALSLMMLTAILTGCTSGDNLGKIEKDLSNEGGYTSPTTQSTIPKQWVTSLSPLTAHC